MEPYAPLYCKSCFSFLEGASQPDELVEQAQALGLPALALTDRDGVYGLVRAHLAVQEAGVRLLCGAEVTVAKTETGTGTGLEAAKAVLLCEDRAGYANLCRLLTRGRLRAPKGLSSVSWAEVCEHARGLLLLLGAEGCPLAAPGSRSERSRS